MPDLLDRLKTALADRYTIERELGAGGMATVYLAEDLKHHRPVALKVLRPELAASLGPERFLAEIRLTAKLQHPHIVPLFDSGEAGGFLYYVMPYVEGESLRQRLERERQLPLDEGLALTRQIASALDCAHEQGIIHRDIKPENILLSKGEAVMADFGIALAVKAAGGPRLTETGLSLGTPQYMSPEQAAADREVDARSDVYSLGAVLYEMLCGEPPHTGPTTPAVIAKLLTQTPIPPWVTRADLSEAVSQAVLKALAKTPADRFATAGAFAAALAAPAEVAAPEKSLVVLPFENLSPDPDNAFFADGLTEELIAALSKVRGLRVISRTSAMLLKDSKKDVPTIARELNVRYVLEGSVRRAGNSLRITAQLIDANTDTHLWADTYRGTLDDVFGIQESVARSIADGLKVTLDAEVAARLAERPITSVAAYDCYLKGMQSMWQWTEAGLAQAVEHLERGLQIAGENALLEAALGYVYYQHAGAGIEPIEQHRDSARQYAERALALDPRAPLAHMTIGLLSAFERPADGIRSLQQVLRIDPSSAEALYWLANITGLSWRPEVGRGFLSTLRGLDPLHPWLRWLEGWLLTFRGRFAQAEQALRAGLEAAPDTITRWLLAQALAYQGQVGEACALFDSVYAEDPRNIAVRIGWALGLALKNERESAWQLVRSDLDVSPPTHRDFMYALWVAECHALLDDTDGALEWIERSVNLGMINYPFLNEYDPFLAPLRRDPRFQRLMERVKKAWEEFEV